MKPERSILITGGAGFIGSNLIKFFVRKYPGYKIINLDKLTYAGNPENLRDIEDNQGYTFIKGDIRDKKLVEKIFVTEVIDSVIHLAAESHVDRSIKDPDEFLQTNVLGTSNLLNVALRSKNFRLFYHISTDEVYGTLGSKGYFTEKTPYDPRSPYSASKAASDHIVRAYHHTYGLPVVISNCSNNYGPFQFPEKLIPLMINNIRNNQKLPVYGEGKNVRDWLYVEDHVAAIDLVFHRGKIGETYNIGGKNEWENIEVVRLLCRILDEKLGREKGTSEKLITFVKDRAGHDLRYAIDPAKIEKELGWQPEMNFGEGLKKTVTWYLENDRWLEKITSGDYRNYYKEQYS